MNLDQNKQIWGNVRVHVGFIGMVILIDYHQRDNLDVLIHKSKEDQSPKWTGSCLTSFVFVLVIRLQDNMDQSDLRVCMGGDWI